MSDIHGLDCDCCKDKLPAVQEIINRANLIMGDAHQSDTDKTLQSLSDLNSSDFSGEISDVVSIAGSFLRIPVESVGVEGLKLEDESKRVGKFLAKDLTDIPGQDVTKLVSFSDSDLSSVDSLKVSLSSGTVEIVKSISIPFQTIKMKFLINRKGYSYFPVIDSGVKNREDALKKIQGVKSLQPVQPSSSLEKAKALAFQKYPTSLEVADIATSSRDTVELINELGKIGVILFEEVDIEAQVRKVIEREDSEQSVVVDNDGLGGLSPAAFNSDELKTIEEDCCGGDKDSDLDGVPDTLDLEDSNPIFLKLGISEDQRKSIVDDNGIVIGMTGFGQNTVSLIEQQLLEMEAKYEIDDETAKVSLDTFIQCATDCTNIIQQCAREKQNAINYYYWFFEAQFLNNIAIEYASSRSMMIDSLNGSFATLEAERIRRVDRSIELKKQENEVIKSAFNRIFPYDILDLDLGSGGSSSGGLFDTQLYALSLPGFVFSTNITASQLDAIENDESFIAEVSSIREEFSSNENAIQKLSNQIQDQKEMFALPSFTDNEIVNLKTFEVTSSASVLSNKTRVCKDEFDIDTNPVTNQVGFTGSSVLKLQVHPRILEESRTLFSLNSPEQGDVENYLVPVVTRGRTIATELWNKYYDPRRIDLLFTYSEQGYTSPKPQFSANGSSLDSTQRVEVKNPLGQTFAQDISQNVLNLGINEPEAMAFWTNIEDRTRNKINLIAQDIVRSQEYQSYVSRVRAAAENEAKYAFAANLIYQENSFTTREFNNYTNTFSVNTSFINLTLNVNLNTGNISDAFTNQYRMVYDSLAGFQQQISEKMRDLDIFIQEKNKCIADQEIAVAECAASYNAKSNGASQGSPSPIEDDCKSKLGSDPNGVITESNCPGVSKNCYWREYTKLMQIVSLMPVIDDVATSQLTKRLFRYFPVGFQIPVPTPTPGVLPTMASGITDPMISIPMPIIWKHIITISSPVGLMVMWITMCGPMPGVYIMFIDERGQPCFIVTPRGPIDIPAKSLQISATDEKSLIEVIPGVKNTFRVPVSGALAKILGGNNKVKTGDPDAPASVLDKIQSKIKSAADSLSNSDPWGPSDTETRKRVSKALRSFPPDQDAISQALRKIEKTIDDQVASMNIKPFKFPQNAKKLIKPIVGPAEFADSFNKLIDSGTNLSSIGLGVKFISLREETKKFIDRELSSPDVRNKFAAINAEIREMETVFSVSGPQGPDRDKVKARAAKLKSALKIPVQSVADKITPAMLGFVALASLPVSLPEPCYDKKTLDPVPPYILLLMASIKGFPALVDSMSDDEVANMVSSLLNLTVPLGKIEDSIFFVVQAFLSVVPNVKYPDTESINLLKANLRSISQNFFKIKLRPPHPGVLQITIPSSAIKSAIGASVKASFAAISTLILNELQEATNDGDFIRVLAVAAIIKGAFGTDLGSITGEDVKAFLVSSLESADDFLAGVEDLLFFTPSVKYKTWRDVLFPPATDIDEGPYLEINTEAMLNAAAPALQLLQNVNLPFPLVLQAASQLSGRLVITKIYPFAAKDIMPKWEKLSLANVPFVVWLDQMISSAQKTGGFGSNYLAPYYLPDT